MHKDQETPETDISEIITDSTQILNTSTSVIDRKISGGGSTGISGNTNRIPKGMTGKGLNSLKENDMNLQIENYATIYKNPEGNRSKP